MEDFPICKYTKLSYLYINYIKLIYQILLVILLLRNDENFMKVEYLIINLYF